MEKWYGLWSADISLEADPDVLTFGPTATINGTLTSFRFATAVADAQILLQYRPHLEETWQNMTVVTTNQSGAFLYEWLPPHAGTHAIRALWDGAGDHNIAISPTRPLRVSKANTTILCSASPPQSF